MKPQQTTNTIGALMLLILVITLLVNSGCEDQTIDPTFASKDKVFNPALFKENIKAKLNQNNADNIGYAFVINHLGKLADSAQVGYARMPQDGSLKWGIKQEMNIASVTKWLTAVGAIRILKEKDISLDDYMWHWLPKTWTKGTGVKTITFRELLTHKTGLTTKDIRYATDYNSLKNCIATGVVNSSKSYNYSNVNFALFRIMFAYIYAGEQTSENENTLLTIKHDTAAFNGYLALWYLSLMQKKVFTPAGVSEAVMHAKDYNPDNITMEYYRFNTNQNGSLPGVDWSLIGGGGGYYLSPVEIASVMAHVIHSDDILSLNQVTEMEDSMLGFDQHPMTDHGRSFEKGGALYSDTNGTPKFNNGDKGLAGRNNDIPRRC